MIDDGASEAERTRNRIAWKATEEMIAWLIAQIGIDECRAEASFGRDRQRAYVEAEVKRQHIARYRHIDRLITEDEANGLHAGAIRDTLLSVRRAYRLVLSDDLVVYWDRPGYRPEWRLT